MSSKFQSQVGDAHPFDRAADGVVEQHDCDMVARLGAGFAEDRRAEQAIKLRAFRETLKTAMLADAHWRPGHQRRTARALHCQIKACDCGAATRA